MVKKNKIILFLWICFFFANGQSSQNLQIFDENFFFIVNTKYAKEYDFIKAVNFYLYKNYDSTLVYCQKQLVTNNKIVEINDYCHYLRARSFQNKKLFKESLKETKLVSKNFKYIYDNTFIAGQLHLEMSQFDKALSHLLDVEKNSLKSTIRISEIYQNIGICYLLLKNYSKAEHYFLAVERLYQKGNNPTFILNTYQNLAALYYDQYKDKLAISYFEKAYLLSKSSKDYNDKKDCAQNMALVEENRNNFKKALEYKKEAEIWNDSLNDQNKIWEIAEVEKKFAVNQKQKEIELLEIKTEVKRTQIVGLTIIATLLIITLLISLYFYKLKVKRNKIIQAQKEDLDELNATKDKLFTIVSHDLRSSVNALKSSNTKLSKFLENKNYEELDSQLHKNSTIANGAYHLLDNLLNWANQQTNQIYFNKESLHLKTIIEHVEYNFKPLEAEKNISLNINIEESYYINMDLDSLKIILRNILDNALKYTNENGTISIISNSQNENFVFLNIEDNGIGMTEEVIVDLLNENNKLSKKNNPEIIGSGLGFQLCKSMIDKNGGKLNLESKIGIGTKILLSLPK